MQEIIALVNEMSPYLLLGFLLAGLMHSFIPNRYYRTYLGGNSFRSVLYATLFGIPLPLCSCGVIPTAMSLRKEGASKGATTAFLIATPQTGVDSIIATYSLMGLPFALVRPIAALCTALFGGSIANIFSKKEIETPIQNIEEQSHKEEKQNFIQKIVSALRYGFVDMMQDIGRWLVLGLIIAGLITVFVPESFFASFTHNSLLSMLIVLLFAIPMYLCATGSIPIAVALMLKGLSPGAALVLLMAGPAANMASILVINKVLGKRNLIIYLFSIISGAILFGLGIDYLLPREWFTAGLTAIQESCHNHNNGWSEYIWTIILSILLINALLLRYCKKEKHCHCDSCDITKQKENYMTITIQGMNCNHCKNSAEKALLSVEGVEKVEIDLASGTTIITGKATIEDVKNAIHSIGFTIKE